MLYWRKRFEERRVSGPAPLSGFAIGVDRTGFPVELGGAIELHAAFLEEKPR